jgi:methionine aminopeptidase
MCHRRPSAGLTLFVISDVCTKYQEASKIVNLALQGIVSQCIPGAKVIDLCEFGHTVLTTTAAKLYTKKVNGVMIDRGIAFPVCISVNDVVCNHSPLLSEERVSYFLNVVKTSCCGHFQVCCDRMPLSS